MYKLDEQLRQTILLLEPQWKEKDFENFTIACSLVRIKADKDLFEQVWQNLIDNSIQVCSDTEGLLK